MNIDWTEVEKIAARSCLKSGQIAKRMKIADTTYSGMKNRNNFTHSTVGRLARALRCDVDEIILPEETGARR